jgi:hypothetical protein
VNRVSELRGGEGLAAPCDVQEALIPGDLPAYRHSFRGHAAAVQGVRSKAGPKHEAIGDRVARSYTERERVRGKAELAANDPRCERHRDRRSRQSPRSLEQLSTVEASRR